MKALNKILRKATSEIDRKYFEVEIDGGDPVLRERVYCYELYHQMRTLWPNSCKYTLTGELDKKSHPILKDLEFERIGGTRSNLSMKIPDLLVHVPGDMAENFAVIEVKHVRSDNAGIKKDIETLSLFIEKAKYEEGILLIFGPGVNMEEKIQSLGVDLLNSALEKGIQFWVHEKAGSSVRNIAMNP